MMRPVGSTCCILFCFSVSVTTAQELQRKDLPAASRPAATTQPTSLPAEAGGADCRRCHACAKPTPENPCLPACTRDRTPQREVALLDQKGPDVVILNELEKVYLPVPFDHKGHAKMAEMTQGCVTCHHYTPAGQQHPACKTCHEITVAGTDIRKPGLKGAYHRQCLNCHREWIDETACAICHMPKTGQAKDGTAEALPTEYDILAHMHSPIPEPDTRVYRAQAQQGAGSQVVFGHREHVHRFGLNCVDCHHEENCTRCHTEDREEKPRPTLAEHHKPCMRCHKVDMDEAVTEIAGRCERCHWREGRPEPKPFDHAATGWPLNRYHRDQPCRACHVQVPFVKLARDCNVCHGKWAPGAFDHQVTGQALDETHAEVACADCHRERKFDRPPKCDECHSESEGFVFPNKRPGPVTSPK